MSGIMAIVSLGGRPVPPELPRAQLAAIAHRGEWRQRIAFRGERVGRRRVDSAVAG